MHEQLEGASPLIAFGIERRLGKHDLASAEGRAKALVDVLEILAPIKTSILAKDYAVKIAGRLHLREQDVLDQLSRMRSPKRYEEDERTTSTNDRVRPAKDPSVRLSTSEQNRLRCEREFLSLCAQNPLLAIARAETLENTAWHDRINSDIASAILEVLETNLNAKTTDMIDAAVMKQPSASSVLTSASVPEGSSPTQIMDYLALQLSIGDMEEQIAGLKSSLADLEAKGISDDDGLFARLVRLQSRLNDARMSR